MAKPVVGVDFGHGVVRGVEVLDAGTRRQRVLRSGSVPLPDDSVVSGEVRDVQGVAAALRQLWSTAGFKSRQVVLGMGNARVLARDLVVPVRPLQQIRESLQFRVADLLPMPIENAILDYYPVAYSADESGAPAYSGMLIAALKDVVVANAEAARRAGLEVIGVDMIPLALIRMLADPADPRTRAFIDVGATTTIVSVATGGVPEFVRAVPLGGEDIVKTLMNLGQLSRDQAEQIKRVVGLSSAGVEPRYRPVVELMVTRSSELMTSVRDTLSYFVETRARPISEIVLTGGGARIGGFADFVLAWTRIPVVLAETPGDPDFLVATALASGARTPATQPLGMVSAPAQPPQPAAAPPVPGVARGVPQPPMMPQQSPTLQPPALPPSAPQPAQKAAKEKKESIWNRPIGGRR